MEYVTLHTGPSEGNDRKKTWFYSPKEGAQEINGGDEYQMV